MSLNEIDPEPAEPITELSKPQRRVLGVLVEKAFTTPENYPLTVKAILSGCNQKSNREPVVNYDEPTVEDVLDELRRLGLVAVIHTESGRTERFRHYMRHRFDFSEPQLAILTELMLRGRQQLGELRSRASRMVPIETQDQLRDELRGLAQMNYVQAGGPLERRGMLVDHNLYSATEAKKHSLEKSGSLESGFATGGVSSDGVVAVSPPSTAQTGRSSDLSERLAMIEAASGQLQMENSQLRSELETVKHEIQQLTKQLVQLRQELGG